MSLKLKDFIIPMSLALGISILFQYMFFGDSSKKESSSTNQNLESGRSHEAPKQAEVHRPLNLEVDFVDTKPTFDGQKTVVQTDYSNLLFSTEGAAIEKIEYKHMANSKEVFLEVFKSEGKEDKAFLVALESKTPYYFKLVDKQETNEQVVLSYQSEFESGLISKRFTVYKKESKIDLDLSITPNGVIKDTIRARIFTPAPMLADVKDDVVQSIYNEADSISKKPVSSLSQRYWEIPSLFGLEDKYFIQAMVKDFNGFAQRGYYKTNTTSSSSAILEGPAITQPTNWKLSFYFGPKKHKLIQVVDPRLEKVLDYGFFAMLSKPLLSILNFFYGFVKNYGIAIILLTLLLKLLLLPFTLKSEESMKKRMDFQRKLQYIQQKYKDDKEGLAIARAELLKKHGMGDVAGCLPLLMQIPIFFALNRVLSNAIELYKAPFLWIPSLSSKDPYYILPILIGVSIIMHAKSTDPRQRFTSYGMALLVAAVSSSLPAGLSLFIFVSSLLTVVQSKIYSIVKK